MKKFALFAFLLLLVLSCDPVVGYSKIIQNNTSYDIWLIPNDSTARLEYIKDSVLLFVGESIIVDSSIDIGDGDPNDYTDCPAYPFSSDTLFTKIEGNNNLKLKFSIDENVNWEFKVIEPGRNGNAECRLILTDTDIN